MPALTGIRVVVTRAAQQSLSLVERLQNLGAKVVALPMIEIVPPADTAPLQQAVDEIERFDWIVFASVNAVNAVAHFIQPTQTMRGKIAAVGTATAAAIERLKWQVALQPDRFVAEDLAGCFPQDMKGQHVLIPTVKGGRDVIAGELEERGAVITVVEAYANEIPAEARDIAPALLQEMGEKDWILFASPSAVEHLVEVAGAVNAVRTKILSIGPSTSEAVRRLGLTVTAEASCSTADGMIDALIDCVRQAGR